ncbi:MAG TPA: hypothetical protein VNO33_07220, partial [Kofleriaceae bacterium]|nr:hypothetical protein [Kofleriaceae bacterium]
MTKVLGLVVASGAVLMVFAPAARAQTIREVSRSSPIVATVGGVEAQYQGSVEVVTPAPAVTTFTGPADATTFQFPHTLGHLRAVDIDDIPTTPTPFELLPRSFDVADLASF